MRAVPLIACLSSIVVLGCTGPISQVRPATGSIPVIRGESDALGELESAAHTKQRKDVRVKPADRKSSGSHCNQCNSTPCSCSSSTESNFGGKVVLYTLSAPFALPRMLVGDDGDHVTEFPDFPFADDVPGSLLINSQFKGKTQPFTANVQTFGVAGSGDLDRFGGRLVLENADRIGIDTETDYWLQIHPHGGPDHAWNGDFNIVYRFAESEHMQWRAGVGLNWLADQTSPEVGVNFTYGFDWFPRRPWTLSSVIDVGTVGGNTLFHNRSTAGVMVGAMELFAGYDYFQIGTFNMQGPVAGIGYRF